MRGWIVLATLGLLLAAGCPKGGPGTPPAAPGAPAAAGWQPGDGLPPEWPIRELSLPATARLFEGHVDVAQDGGKDITVFFTSGDSWEAVLADIEGKLKPLDYRRMPQGEADGGAAARNQAWCSPAGKLVALLTYDEDPAAAEKLGQPGYYTLLVKQPKDALPVDPAWEKIS